MTSTYSALLCTQAGAPEAVLQLETLPQLPLAPEQIRVRVQAAGVNPADLLQVTGRYQIFIPYPFSPGFEVFGEVIEVGSAADVAIGQTVLGVMTSGAYASEVILNLNQAVVLDPRLVKRTGVAALAAMPVAYATAHLALNRRARVQPEERVIVTGATGAVGSAAVQVAQSLGCRVTALVRGGTSVDGLWQPGVATHVLGDDVKASVQGLQGDVIIDTVGGELGEALIERLTPEGRLIIVGAASGRAVLIPSLALLVGDSGVLGVDFSSYVQREPQVVTDALRQVLEWVAMGQVNVNRPRVVGLSKGAVVLAAMARGERSLKTVLLINGHDH